MGGRGRGGGVGGGGVFDGSLLRWVEQVSRGGASRRIEQRGREADGGTLIVSNATGRAVEDARCAPIRAGRAINDLRCRDRVSGGVSEVAAQSWHTWDANFRATWTECCARCFAKRRFDDAAEPKMTLRPCIVTITGRVGSCGDMQATSCKCLKPNREVERLRKYYKYVVIR